MAAFTGSHEVADRPLNLESNAYNCLYADQELFDIFFIPVIKGDADNLVIRPGTRGSNLGHSLLLAKEFVKWVAMGIVIAFPIAYYVMDRWLQSFAYRTSISLWIFVVSATLALVIALITVSYQSIKAAIANPVDSLRYE